METSSCHSNESTWATAIKNIIFVEANVMNISAKFQFHPTYGSEEMIFEYFFCKFILSVAMETNQIQRFGQNSCLAEDYSRNISVKLLSKYLQWDSNKGLLSLFPLQVNENYVVIATKAQATAIKNKLFIESNVVNIIAKFQVHPPLWFLRRWFFNIFSQI